MLAESAVSGATAVSSGLVGDSLTVGETAFAIIGTIVSVPGDVGIRSAFGPRIFLAGQYLDETKLLGFGARAEYEAYLQLPPGADPQVVAEHYRPELRPERVRIRKVRNRPRTGPNGRTRPRHAAPHYGLTIWSR